MSYAMTSRQKRHFFSPIHSALACKQLKKLKKMAIKGSSSDEEEEDGRSSSNDEKEPMNPNLYKQVKQMNKYLGYIVFLKDGPHHQLMKTEKKFKKNKINKEKKPKHELFAIFGEWEAVLKNQVLAQAMNQARNSPSAPT